MLEQYNADKSAGKPITNSQAVAAADMGGKLVKRPGDKEWVPATPRALAQMQMQIRCPDKSNPELVP